MTPLDAVLGLILAPFVATCLAAIVCAVAVVMWHERPARNPYMAPWRDRKPGDLS